MSKKVEIDIEAIEIEEENYHLFISAKAGRKKVRLLLDTGASKTVFDLEQIAEISGKKNEIHKTESVGLGASKVETSLFNLSSLNIGEIKLKNNIPKGILAILCLQAIHQHFHPCVP